MDHDPLNVKSCLIQNKKFTSTLKVYIRFFKNGFSNSINHFSGQKKNSKTTIHSLYIITSSPLDPHLNFILSCNPWRRVKFVICPLKHCFFTLLQKSEQTFIISYLFKCRFKVVCWSMNINYIWAGLSWIHCYLHTLTRTG